MQTLDRLSFLDLKQALISGAIVSEEVAYHFILKARETNPDLNAIVLDRYEKALGEAKAADESLRNGSRPGKLHGLPITIKECLDLAGTPSTFGLLRRKQDIPSESDPYVAALQAAGAIILGKTNVSQMLMFLETENPVYGTTNNPHSPIHSPGGSSGGEGAIVAAGGCIAGLGTDIGGSVRIPAAFSGICSIKPTMDRCPDHARFIPNQPDLPVKSVTGILAREVDALESLLGVINPGSATPIPDSREVPIDKLRVGYFFSDNLFEPMSAIRATVEEAVQIVRSAGAEVVAFEPPNLAEAEEIYFRILAANKGELFAGNLQNDKPVPQAAGLVRLARAGSLARRTLRILASAAGQRSLSRIIPYFGGSGSAYIEEWAARQSSYIERYLSAMSDSPIGRLDAVISPVCAVPAYLHRTADRLGLGGTYCLQHNLTGFPAGVATLRAIRPYEAIARPLAADLSVRTAARTEAASAALPLAVQVAGRPWEEHKVLALIRLLHRQI